MGLGEPGLELGGKQRASPSGTDTLSKNRVTALPGSPQSERPRHPAPYLQSLGLPKEGQRVRV